MLALTKYYAIYRTGMGNARHKSISWSLLGALINTYSKMCLTVLFLRKSFNGCVFMVFKEI